MEEEINFNKKDGIKINLQESTPRAGCSGNPVLFGKETDFLDRTIKIVSFDIFLDLFWR